jgi:hypothetical protein
MTKFDKLLLALTAAGIWALVIQNAVPMAVAHDQDFNPWWVFNRGLERRVMGMVSTQCKVWDVSGPVKLEVDKSKVGTLSNGTGRITCDAPPANP